MNCHAFTLSESNIVRRLQTKLHIFNKYTKGQDLNSVQKWVGIWDTGATTTCITSSVASALNLIPTGTATTSTAGGVKECNTYCIDIILPNDIIIYGLTVFEVELSNGDALIGMDIIRHGDFVITNYNGKTKFSFRIPSQESTDYVEIINNNNKGISD